MGSSISLVSSCLPSTWITITLALIMAALKRFFFFALQLIPVVKRAAQYIVYGGSRF